MHCNAWKEITGLTIRFNKASLSHKENSYAGSKEINAGKKINLVLKNIDKQLLCM